MQYRIGCCKNKSGTHNVVSTLHNPECDSTFSSVLEKSRRKGYNPLKIKFWNHISWLCEASLVPWKWSEKEVVHVTEY